MGQTMNTWIGFILTSEELYWLQSCQPVFTEIIITEPKLWLFIGTNTNSTCNIKPNLWLLATKTICITSQFWLCYVISLVLTLKGDHIPKRPDRSLLLGQQQTLCCLYGMWSSMKQLRLALFQSGWKMAGRYQFSIWYPQTQTGIWLRCFWTTLHSVLEFHPFTHSTIDKIPF